MSRKKVLLFSSESLLGSAIRCLLSSDQQLEVTIVESDDLGELVGVSRKLKPDVVILEQNLLASYSGLLNRLLGGGGKSRVITLEENQNILHIYSGHEVSLERSSDLLTILHSNNILT